MKKIIYLLSFFLLNKIFSIEIDVIYHDEYPFKCIFLNNTHAPCKAIINYGKYKKFNIEKLTDEEYKNLIDENHSNKDYKIIIKKGEIYFLPANFSFNIVFHSENNSNYLKTHNFFVEPYQNIILTVNEQDYTVEIEEDTYSKIVDSGSTEIGLMRLLGLLNEDLSEIK